MDEIAVKVQKHETEITELTRRVDSLEKLSDTIHSLAISTEKLVVNVQHMAEEQLRQRKSIERFGERLERLENIPAEKWKSTGKSVAAAIISTVIGAVVTAAIILLTGAMQF